MLFRNFLNVSDKKRRYANKNSVLKSSGNSDFLDLNKGSFVTHLMKFKGEVVTIFTGSGGQSGSGFTGILITVNEVFIRLITQIGPWPGCSLGNMCSNIPSIYVPNNIYFYGVNGIYPIYTLGVIVDIPTAKIVALTHNVI